MIHNDVITPLLQRLFCLSFQCWLSLLSEWRRKNPPPPSQEADPRIGATIRPDPNRASHFYRADTVPMCISCCCVLT